MPGRTIASNLKALSFAALLAAGTASMTAAGSALAQEDARRGGAIDVATIGEPPTLDPAATTTDVVGMIALHYFEGLYTFGEGWQIVPMLAAGMPEVGGDGTVYTIALREGVPFHDGSTMTAEDVVASLQRWLRVAVRGKQADEFVETVEAVDDHTVRITLSEPYAPLLGLLSLATSAAVVMPAELAASDEMGEIVGTGPYRFVERVPDRYIRVQRFEDYAARDEEPALYGGRRTAHLDEIRFVPVPNANTRVEGALSGQYAFADSLPAETFGAFQGQDTAEPVVVEPFGWPLLAFNARQGALTDPRLREAVVTALGFSDMLTAAFGDPAFFQADGSLYPEGFVWHTDAGAGAYDAADPAKARQLAEAAGYAGAPIRVLTSMQYEFHYKMALVMAEYLKLAGFTVDLQVVDWATLTQRRGQPELWEIYITHSPFLPEPALNSYLSSDSPTGWDTPEMRDVVTRFNRESDPERRAEVWAEVQELVYEQFPIAKIGNFNALGAKRTDLQGYEPLPWPVFWNVSLGTN